MAINNDMSDEDICKLTGLDMKTIRGEWGIRCPQNDQWCSKDGNASKVKNEGPKIGLGPSFFYQYIIWTFINIMNDQFKMNYMSECPVSLKKLQLDF